MAILGFHVVVSLVMLTIISKLSSRMFIIQMYITKGLIRFMAPSNDDIRTLMPFTKENSRARRKKREEDIPDGFKVPKSLPLRLKMKRVEEVDLHNLPLYSSFYWLSLFVPHCLVVYLLSEAFLFLYPDSVDFNVSILWLLVTIGFVLQVLVRLTSWLVVNQEERNVLLIFAAIFFLFAFIFTTQADHFFDIQLLAGYDQFCANIEALVAEAGITDQKNAKSRDPIILYVSISILFSFIAAMLVFPNFRYANMYSNAVKSASRSYKLVLHATFILPFVTLLLYTLSLKEQLVYGPRKIFNEEQFNILRIYLTITVLVFRLLFRTAHFQAHLDLSAAKFNALKRENGYIKNIALQAMILQYYSYICVAVLQYFSPVLLSSFLALLLKTAGRMSWLGRESVLPSTSVGGMISILDPVVCRALLSFSLLFTTLTNVVLSSIGVMYNSNLLP